MMEFTIFFYSVSQDTEIFVDQSAMHNTQFFLNGNFIGKTAQRIFCFGSPFLISAEKIKSRTEIIMMKCKRSTGKSIWRILCTAGQKHGRALNKRGGFGIYRK